VEGKQNKIFTWPKLKQNVATVDREYIFYGPVKFTAEMELFYLDEITYAEISNKYAEQIGSSILCFIRDYQHLTCYLGPSKSVQM
jgi:hypothetical protein